MKRGGLPRAFTLPSGLRGASYWVAGEAAALAVAPWSFNAPFPEFWDVSTRTPRPSFQVNLAGDGHSPIMCPMPWHLNTGCFLAFDGGKDSAGGSRGTAGSLRLEREMDPAMGFGFATAGLMNQDIAVLPRPRGGTSVFP